MKGNRQEIKFIGKRLDNQVVGKKVVVTPLLFHEDIIGIGSKGSKRTPYGGG